MNAGKRAHLHPGEDREAGAVRDLGADDEFDRSGYQRLADPALHARVRTVHGSPELLQLDGAGGEPRHAAHRTDRPPVGEHHPIEAHVRLYIDREHRVAPAGLGTRGHRSERSTIGPLRFAVIRGRVSPRANATRPCTDVRPIASLRSSNA